jgi:hypothetical protein
MFDSFGPGTGFGTGAFMGGIMQDLMQGAGTYEDWSRGAVEVATSAQATYRHYIEDAERPNLQAAARDLDMIGREAQKLAVIAENRGYGEEEMELMRRLDKLCLRFTNGAPNTEKTPDELLAAELPGLVSDIFDVLDREQVDDAA